MKRKKIKLIKTIRRRSRLLHEIIFHSYLLVHCSLSQIYLLVQSLIRPLIFSFVIYLISCQVFYLFLHQLLNITSMPNNSSLSSLTFLFFLLPLIFQFELVHQPYLILPLWLCHLSSFSNTKGT